MKSPWENMDELKNVFSYNKRNNFLQKFNFNFSIAVIPLIILVIFVTWLLSGIYKVNEGEEAVVIRFGKYARKAYPGLNYHLPNPIEEAIVKRVNISRQTEIGYRTSMSRGRSNNAHYIFQNSNSTDISKYIPAESTMLTGDENIIELNCNVRWHIKNLYDFIFSVDHPEETVKIVAESAIREVISETLISSVLSNQKQEIADKIENLIQQILDQYCIGIEIDAVELLKAEPPSEVIDAYRDVQTSRADKEREINQAQAYRNDKIPEARGKAARMVEEAEGLKQSLIAKAIGDTQKFNAILTQYHLNKEVTKERLYLNTIESILQGNKKFIISEDSKLLPHMGISSK